MLAGNSELLSPNHFDVGKFIILLPIAFTKSCALDRDQVWNKDTDDILNSSKKVWKSEFDQELLSYLSNNRRMLGIIRTIVKFSLK